MTQDTSPKVDEVTMEPPLLHRCNGVHCFLPASLSCPTCLKLNVPKSLSRFCSQTCFKNNWSTHKVIHAPEYDPFQHQFNYTGSLRAVYPLSPMRTLPPHIQRPDYAESGYSRMEDFERRTKFIDVLNSEEIQRMRTACKIARTILDTAAKWIAPGVCTDTLDQVVHEACIDHECYPSPLNYMGFPKSCCTSINEVICHGIPDRRPLQEGELINIDISIYKDGMHADLSETYMVGNQVSLEAYRLVEGTREALKDAIEQVRPGTMYRDLGKVIEARANQDRLGVVRTYCGHGIHKYFHCKPNVPHYAKNKAIGIMKPGHVFTIEPMLTLGEFREVHWPDHWTAVTKDGRFSAQFEHTLLVTETGYEILTLGQPQDTVMDGLPEKWKCRPTT